ncbi:head GIN domain-containing protein [Emticicia sp.]|uniref:head GIN domain-containing protein n=1 Tax=Emticicia sp. TaxID=1930953 RepID=UPI003751C1C2
MKRSLVVIFTILLGVFGLLSCNTYNIIEGSGIVQTEYRRTPYFNRLELYFPAEVILRQGTAKDIEIVAENNIINLVISRVSGNTLILDDNGRLRGINNVKIYIQVPDINAVYVSGSGKVISDNKIFSKNMSLRLSGSGLIDMALDVKNDLEADLSGSGLIFLEGDTYNGIYDVSGSGKIESFDMHADNSDVVISSSGRCETTALNNLDVSISGSGSVWFRGNPRISKYISGSGKIFNAN